jgi:hypothetical protein
MWPAPPGCGRRLATSATLPLDCAAGRWRGRARSSTPYGLPRRERSRVVDAAIEIHDWCYDIVRQAVTDGHQTFEGVWRDGGEQRAERTRRWIAAHREHMRAALGAE